MEIALRRCASLNQLDAMQKMMLNKKIAYKCKNTCTLKDSTSKDLLLKARRKRETARETNYDDTNICKNNNNNSN